MFTKENSLDIEGYTNADQARSIDDKCFTSSYFIFMGGSLVTWWSKKKDVVARSCDEAEYKGMAKGLCELLWIRNLRQNLHI